MFIAEIQDLHPELITHAGTVSDENILAFSSLQFSVAAPEIDKLVWTAVERSALSRPARCRICASLGREMPPGHC